jgi:hypothetical protein
MIRSRGMGWAEHIASMGEKSNVYRALVGKPEEKRLRHKWEDKRTDVGEIGWGGMDCIHLAQDRDQWRTIVSAVMNLRIQYNAGKLLSGWQLLKNGSIPRS